MKLGDFVTVNIGFKKKHLTYILHSDLRDSLGTRVLWFKKSEKCKREETVKLYIPLQDKILRETSDVCRYCKQGYEQHHHTVFSNKTLHIQATCSSCHRYLRYVPQQQPNLLCPNLEAVITMR